MELETLVAADHNEFKYELLPSVQAVRDAIAQCEGKHVQQVCYSSFMATLTQLCFTCQRIRSTVEWEGSRSWSKGA